MKKLFFNHFNTSQESNLLPNEIILVRPDSEILVQQDLPNFVGISANTAGAKKISMNLAVIPPGAGAEPHFHPDHETAIYLLKGRIETYYGQGLTQMVVMETGDFMFVPPGVPHQPRNLSASEPAYALIARSNSSEQEDTVLYDPTLEDQ